MPGAREDQIEKARRRRALAEAHLPILAAAEARFDLIVSDLERIGADWEKLGSAGFGTGKAADSFYRHIERIEVSLAAHLRAAKAWPKA